MASTFSSKPKLVLSLIIWSQLLFLSLAAARAGGPPRVLNRNGTGGPQPLVTYYRLSEGGSTVLGAPFSAEGFNELLEAPPGNSVASLQSIRWKMFRDVAGRVRIEQAKLSGPVSPGPLVLILDPQQSLKYMLDDTAKIAWRADWNPPRVAVSPPGRAESLGSRVIEGLPCDGNRTISLVPAAVSSDRRPFEVVTDIWKSPDLKIG
jgi:hypothetical protein